MRMIVRQKPTDAVEMTKDEVELLAKVGRTIYVLNLLAILIGVSMYYVECLKGTKIYAAIRESHLMTQFGGGDGTLYFLMLITLIVTLWLKADILGNSSGDGSEDNFFTEVMKMGIRHQNLACLCLAKAKQARRERRQRTRQWIRGKLAFLDNLPFGTTAIALVVGTVLSVIYFGLTIKAQCNPEEPAWQHAVDVIYPYMGLMTFAYFAFHLLVHMQVLVKEKDDFEYVNVRLEKTEGEATAKQPV